MIEYKRANRTHRVRATMIVCGFGLVIATRADADIPQPDAIVYGTLHIDGEAVGPAAPYSVFARVEGFEDPVSVYRLGDHAALGHRYVLHFPHGVQEDGRTSSVDFPKEGTLAELYVVNNANGNEVYMESVNVPCSGEAQQLDLEVSAKDLDAAYALNDSTGGGCSSQGGMCGAVGVISPLLMLCGLVRMRLRVRR